MGAKGCEIFIKFHLSRLGKGSDNTNVMINAYYLERKFLSKEMSVISDHLLFLISIKKVVSMRY